MRRGVTRLAPTVKVTPRVDQLRPITMLDVDYGIKSRLLTTRLGAHMETQGSNLAPLIGSVE